MRAFRELLMRNPMEVFTPLIVFAVTLLFAYVARRMILGALRVWSTRTKARRGQVVINVLRTPLLIWSLILAVHLAIQLSDLPARYTRWSARGLIILWVLSLTLMFMRLARELVRSYGDQIPGALPVSTLTETLAQQSSAVLVLEPSYGPKGAVKTARKGVGEYSLKVTGVAAHSGLDFEKGQSAILELARQIQAISKMVDLKRGLTLNVGLVGGGTRINVVAAEATASLDVRVARMKDAAGIDKQLRSLKPFNRKCKLEITGGVNRPAMERTAGVAALYQKAVQIARDLGWKLSEAAVGGGSDGNFTAGLGIPTLDGLGGVGDGAHAVHEFINIAELPRRAALLAGLIESA